MTEHISKFDLLKFFEHKIMIKQTLQNLWSSQFVVTHFNHKNNICPTFSKVFTE